METNVISLPLFATPEQKILNIYLFKVNIMSTWRCDLYSKLTSLNIFYDFQLCNCAIWIGKYLLGCCQPYQHMKYFHFVKFRSFTQKVWKQSFNWVYQVDTTHISWFDSLLANRFRNSHQRCSIWKSCS